MICSNESVEENESCFSLFFIVTRKEYSSGWNFLSNDSKDYIVGINWIDAKYLYIW